MGGAVVRLFQATMGHPQPSKIIVGAVRDRGMCCLAGGGGRKRSGWGAAEALTVSM